MCPVCKNRDAEEAEFSQISENLSSMVEEGTLRDIENFAIFRGLKGTCFSNLCVWHGHETELSSSLKTLKLYCLFEHAWMT